MTKRLLSVLLTSFITSTVYAQTATRVSPAARQPHAQATRRAKDLIGVVAGLPRLFFDGSDSGSLTYDPGSHQFVISSPALSMAFFEGDGQPGTAASGDSYAVLSISLQVDNAGRLIGTPTDRDFVFRAEPAPTRETTLPMPEISSPAR